MVALRLLGPVEIRTPDGWVAAGTPKACGVLAALAMSSAALSVPELAQRVWGARPPDAAPSILYGHVSRLRTALRRCARDITIDSSRNGGYRLRAAPEEIDLFSLRAQVEQAAVKAEAGDRRAAVTIWRRVCASWNGSALVGVDGVWADQVREILRTEYLTVLTGRYEVELALGNHHAVIAELSEHAARFPHAESLAGQLMLALYRDGRATEALDWYNRTRRRLVEDKGSDPGPELQRLQRRILCDDRRLQLSPPVEGTAATAAGDLPLAQLPAGTSMFVGRHRQLRDLRASATRCAAGTAAAVAVVDGMAGVGKTAFAIHAARQVSDLFPDGQIFLDLHGFTAGVAPVTPADALDRLLRALGTPAARIPEHVEDRAALYRGVLNGRRLLIVLDNAADEEQVRFLLPADGGTFTIITSRSRLLGLTDACHLPLDVLPRREAVDLFARLARMTSPSGEDHDVVADIVDHCGRLPLAIAIAAMRLLSRSYWTAGTLLERLGHDDRRLPELQAGNRAIAAVFDTSYRSLREAERSTFRLLGLIPGVSFAVHGAAALTGTPVAEVEERLAALIDSHLLTCDEEQRYRLHDLLRQYAAQLTRQEDGAETRDAALARLFEMYRTAAFRAGAQIDRFMGDALPFAASPYAPAFRDREDAYTWLRCEWVNLRTALTAAEGLNLDAQAVDIARSLWRFLTLQHYIAEAVVVASQGLLAARRLGNRASESLLLNQRGAARVFGTDYLDALEDYRRSRAIRADVGDVRGEAGVLNNLGNVYFRLGRFTDAIRSYEEGLALDEHLVGEGLVALLRSNCAMPLLRLGRHREASRHLTVAAEVFQRMGNELDLSHVEFHLGEAARQAGATEEASRLYHLALDRATRVREPRGCAYAMNGLACLLREQGDLSGASLKHEEALRITRELTDRQLETNVLHDWGRTLEVAGRLHDALGSFREGAAVASAINSPDFQARALDGVARVLEILGRERDAQTARQEANALYRQCGLPEITRSR